MLHEEVWYAKIFRPELHFRDATNVLLLAQPLFTMAAICMVIAGWHHATIVAVIANVLMWLRVLHYFQGIPIFGFMVYLISESAKDMMPFLSLLIIILFAFASSWRPWAIANPDPETMGEWMESEVNPLSHIPSGVLRSFLMLSGDWDMDEISSSDYPWMSQMIFFVFVTVGPIVMLNILIAILADTYGSVMESQREVLLQLQLHETLALEAIYDWYETKLMRCCHNCLRPGAEEMSDMQIERTYSCFPGRKPRWLHVLREDEDEDSDAPEVQHKSITTKLDNAFTRAGANAGDVTQMLAEIKRTLEKQGDQIQAIIETQIDIEEGEEAIMEGEIDISNQIGGLAPGGVHNESNARPVPRRSTSPGSSSSFSSRSGLTISLSKRRAARKKSTMARFSKTKKSFAQAGRDVVRTIDIFFPILFSRKRLCVCVCVCVCHCV